MISPVYAVGTSGWIYKDWAKHFYPSKLAAGQMLAYYAQYFDTVEVNYSFYRLPSVAAFCGWYDQTPPGFRFSVKLSRYLTHLKQLTADQRTNDGINLFCARVSNLRTKLGPILIQLPAGLKADTEKLDNLVKAFGRAETKYQLKFSLAVEARHDSWFQSDIVEQLKHHKITLVINSNPASSWPATRLKTSELAYLRFHGSKSLYASSYSDEELTDWSQFIKQELRSCTSIYCYFNNDKSARAIDNAMGLRQKLD